MQNKAYSGGQNNNSVLKEICRGIYTYLKYINTPKWFKNESNTGKCVKAILK